MVGSQSYLIVSWQKLAEFAVEHLAEGRLVLGTGRICYRAWKGKDGQKHLATETASIRNLYSFVCLPLAQ